MVIMRTKAVDVSIQAVSPVLGEALELAGAGADAADGVIAGAADWARAWEGVKAGAAKAVIPARAISMRPARRPPHFNRAMMNPHSAKPPAAPAPVAAVAVINGRGPIKPRMA